MTLQEAFDKIYVGTRTQQVRAVGKYGDCAFINEKGERCFLGMLLTVEQAKRAEAGKWFTERIAKETGLEEHLLVLRKLMGTHDGCLPADWDASLARIADEHGVVYPPAVAK